MVITADKWLDALDSVDPGAGLLLMAAGLIQIVFGWRIFRLLVILNFAAIGALLVLQVVHSWPLNLILGSGAAIVSGAISWYVVKTAASLLAGLGGALAAGGLAANVRLDDTLVLVAALVGFVTAFSLAFVLLRHIVIVVTSLEGGLLFVSGAVSLLGTSESLYEAFRKLAVETPLVLPLAFLVPTLIGVLVQLGALPEREPQGAGPAR